MISAQKNASGSLATAAAVAMLLVVAAPVARGDIVIRNQCPFDVTAFWRNAANPTNALVLSSNGGSTTVVTGGSWPGGVIYGSQSGNNDTSHANLAEFTIGGSGGQDTYDISNVNAWNINMLINPTTIAGGAQRSGQTCGTINCSPPNGPFSLCQGNNNVLKVDGDGLFCVNVDGPGPVATANTQAFKSACPTSYSYSLDDATSTFTCPTGTNYEVVFCP